jgi:hypothetical protein
LPLLLLLPVFALLDASRQSARLLLPLRLRRWLHRCAALSLAAGLLPAGQHALQAAAELCWAFGQALWVVTALPLVPAPDNVLGTQIYQAKLCRRCCAALAHPGCAGSCCVLHCGKTWHNLLQGMHANLQHMSARCVHS